MKILLYEFLTGGGLHAHPFPAAAAKSLQQEGAAMLRAVAEDFAAVAGCELTVFCDRRWRDRGLPACQQVEIASREAERRDLGQHSRTADWTVLIAPECEGLLLERARWVEAVGGRLLGPTAECIGLAGHKPRTAEWLADRGIPVPAGGLWNVGEPWPSGIKLPAVIKPPDGAGAEGVRQITDRKWLDQVAAQMAAPLRVEAFRSGVAASVAVLAGPAGVFPLPACRQQLAVSAEGNFRYLGGGLLANRELADRGRQMALRAVQALPGAFGYVGVDLVLGESAASDCVIEINPRLTTSYVGLRAACRGNLAKAMLEVAAGETPRLNFAPGGVEFAADGTVSLAGASA